MRNYSEVKQGNLLVILSSKQVIWGLKFFIQPDREGSRRNPCNDLFPSVAAPDQTQ